MKNKYEIIDLKTWKRAMHCQAFRQAVQPQYCVSFEIDISNFYKRIKQNYWSFTFAMVYAVAKCANEIDEFKYRFEEGNIVLYDNINTSFTYLDKATELFKVVNVEMQNSLEEYIKIAEETERKQKDYFTGPMSNDIFQFSAIPWISFTHISHTDSGKKDNAVPLFDWGKFFERDKKLILPFSVQAHHSFVDGIHIGRLAEKLQKYLNEY